MTNRTSKSGRGAGDAGDTPLAPLAPHARCGNCFWASPAQNDSQVLCNRFPPSPFLLNISRDQTTGQLNGTETISLNPVMSKLQRCGEWREAPHEAQETAK